MRRILNSVVVGLVAISLLCLPIVAVAQNENPTVKIEPVGTWSTEVGGVARPGPDSEKSFKVTITPESFKAKIRFRLVSRSSEKGVALNAGNETTPDLTFRKQEGFVEPAENADTIATRESVNSATVKVTARDYGAFGEIQAELLAPSDVKILLKTEKIKVLKDEDANNIEDAWDNKYPAAGNDKKGDADVDGKPAVAKVKGDWLTRYEEYRGFFVLGTWTDTDPGVIDWFFVDVDKIDQLADMTSAIFNNMGLRRLATDEVDRDGVVNFNRGHASKIAQKATQITNSDQVGGGWGLTNSSDRNWFIPNNITYCRVFVDRPNRVVRTDGATSKAQRYVLLRENDNSGDKSDLWQPDGKTRIGEEVVTYRNLQVSGQETTLAYPFRAGQTVILMDPGPLNTIRAENFFVVGDELMISDNKEKYFPDRIRRTKLAEDIDATTTKFKVDDVRPFNIRGYNFAFLVVNDEAMQLKDFDLRTNVVEVERGKLGSIGAAHKKGDEVIAPAAWHNVKRKQFDSIEADHARGARVRLPRALYGLIRANDAKDHPDRSEVPYFFSAEQVNAKIAMTLAHEAGHTIGFDHTPSDSRFIMKPTTRPGSFNGNGIYHVHAEQNFKEMQVRKPDGSLLMGMSGVLNWAADLRPSYRIAVEGLKSSYLVGEAVRFDIFLNSVDDRAVVVTDSSAQMEGGSSRIWIRPVGGEWAEWPGKLECRDVPGTTHLLMPGGSVRHRQSLMMDALIGPGATLDPGEYELTIGYNNEVEGVEFADSSERRNPRAHVFSTPVRFRVASSSPARMAALEAFRAGWQPNAPMSERAASWRQTLLGSLPNDLRARAMLMLAREEALAGRFEVAASLALEAITFDEACTGEAYLVVARALRGAGDEEGARAALAKSGSFSGRR